MNAQEAYNQSLKNSTCNMEPIYQQIQEACDKGDFSCIVDDLTRAEMTTLICNDYTIEDTRDESACCPGVLVIGWGHLVEEEILNKKPPKCGILRKMVLSKK